SIQHVMDDSKRPDVPIRMDMPGWSDTYGFYSKASGTFQNHKIKLNLNGFYNKSLAEMTMYPNNPSEKEMFMYTWPDVRTLYNGIYMEDQFPIHHRANIKLTANLGSHTNKVKNHTGLQSLRIFYPEMEARNHRILPGASTSLQLQKSNLSYNIGFGYGERAPSVSEGYGFYLFNSFDGFDYIGNPNLNNEKSFELNAAMSLKNDKWNASFSGSYFHIRDYIIGKPDNSLSPMTIGANGVKIYEQLKYASLFNSSLDLNYFVNENWTLSGNLVYNYGRDFENRNLPLVQPFTYFSFLQFKKGFFSVEGSVEGALKQRNFSPEFGENSTPAYTILNLSAAHMYYFGEQKLTVKIGAENIFDTYYSTFSDWNNIPRRGRNLFLNLNYIIL
uniref:TonB-dependent receptor domain-containing protein n=1 Tax=Salinimicrobium sp. GXAS 041 TaxID=3400806 RepID=UPI003C757787